MIWKTRLGLAGWLLLFCYLWVAQPVLMATILLDALVAGMLALAIAWMAVGRARRKRF